MSSPLRVQEEKEPAHRREDEKGQEVGVQRRREARHQRRARDAGQHETLQLLLREAAAPRRGVRSQLQLHSLHVHTALHEPEQQAATQSVVCKRTDSAGTPAHLRKSSTSMSPSWSLANCAPRQSQSLVRHRWLVTAYLRQAVRTLSKTEARKKRCRRAGPTRCALFRKSWGIYQ